jgi:hypothetical protein
MLALPAWANKKLTVQQLKNLLDSLQQDRKIDALAVHPNILFPSRPISAILVSVHLV